MKNFLVSLYYLFPAIIAIILVLLTPIPSAQLTTSENRILLQVQKLLEYPQALQGWTNLTNFCSLPPPLSIVCFNGHVTELTVVGNSSWTLSERFSIESFFTVLTKLSNMKVLSLVSLGLWGPLPSKIDRFWSLEVMNFSSNFIYGEISPSVSSLKNLKSLVLANNLFNGSVPDLGKLASLEELNLSGNKLGPEFPSLSKNLVRVILRNNSLRCRIPPQLIHVYKLELFDISSNVIFGNIPSFIFSLPSLKYLNLASNQLSGYLSLNVSCSSSLTFVDISHNLLVGTLPSCIGSNASNRTTLYYGNCLVTRSLLSDQYPSSYCQKVESLAAVKPSIKSQKREPEMELGQIIGIVGGVVGIAGLMVLLIWCIFRKSYLRHRHLVSVLGHCVITHHDHPQMISTIFIVFEHVSNVSLRDYLADRRKREMLKWPQRMAISIGIARGIQFLHTRVHPGIFGNNIKIENILLDDCLNAKVSGYSIPWPSKKGHDSKLYDQRALNQIGSINDAEKEDIYQFGVILLEVITGKLITSSSEVEELKNDLERGLAEASSPSLKGATPSLKGTSPILKGMSDSSLRDTCVHESLKTTVQITISCLSKVSSNRPSIEDILWNLQYSMQVQEPRTSGVHFFTDM